MANRGEAAAGQSDGQYGLWDPLALAYHELRSPLSLIVTAARAALDDSVDRVERARWQIVLKTAERMLRTSEDVFSIALNDGPGKRIRYWPARIVGAVVSDSRALGVPIELTLYPKAASAAAHGPPDRFEALVQSVLMNAAEHGMEGVPIKVEVAALTDVVEVRIENSIGAQRSHRGMGTGLYLCARMAASFGAGFTAGADGGTFRTRLTVPFLTGEASSTKHSRSRQRSPGRPGPGRSSRSSAAAH